MKLFKSILPLKNKLECTVFMLPRFREVAKRIYDDASRNPNISDAYTTLRYAMWYGLSVPQRHEVISHSELECIGGYYQYSDAHLDTLLRKVLPTTYLIKIIAS